MEKKPLYVDADPDDTRLQPVPPPPITVVQTDVSQYIGQRSHFSFLFIVAHIFLSELVRQGHGTRSFSDGSGIAYISACHACNVSIHNVG
jgi:hypothetical protein